MRGAPDCAGKENLVPLQNVKLMLGFCSVAFACGCKDTERTIETATAEIIKS